MQDSCRPLAHWSAVTWYNRFSCTEVAPGRCHTGSCLALTCWALIKAPYPLRLAASHAVSLWKTRTRILFHSYNSYHNCGPITEWLCISSGWVLAKHSSTKKSQDNPSLLGLSQKFLGHSTQKITATRQCGSKFLGHGTEKTRTTRHSPCLTHRDLLGQNAFQNKWINLGNWINCLLPGN